MKWITVISKKNVIINIKFKEFDQKNEKIIQMSYNNKMQSKDFCSKQNKSLNFYNKNLFLEQNIQNDSRVSMMNVCLKRDEKFKDHKKEIGLTFSNNFLNFSFYPDQDPICIEKLNASGQNSSFQTSFSYYSSEEINPEKKEPIVVLKSNLNNVFLERYED